MGDKNAYFVSIIIPCRNEENFISKCLDSIINQDYPANKIEIIVVDGISTDKTREVLKKYTERYSFIRVLENRRKITPVAMNIGIKEAKGEVVIFVNAHSILDKNFLKHSTEYLSKMKATAVGGTLNTIVENNSIIAKAIPMAVDSVFGAGGKRYRSSEREGWVRDTLPYCAYPREVFDKYGLVDEELVRGQDAEFNYRILKKGGRIYYTPKIKSYLYIRPNLRKLARQHFQYGYFRVLISKKVGLKLMIKQLVPPVFVLSTVIFLIGGLFNNLLRLIFIVILGMYLVSNIIFSIILSLKNGLKYFFVLPLCFITEHFSYGLGFIKGIIDFTLFKKHRKGKIKDIPLSR